MGTAIIVMIAPGKADWYGMLNVGFISDNVLANLLTPRL